MTAAELIEHAAAAGITLSVGADPWGNALLEYVAPPGAMTPALKAQLRAKKEGVLALLKASHPPREPTLPQPEASVYRRWVTGQDPLGWGRKLPAPRYRASPSPPTVYLGEACTVSACAATAGVGSQRFFPTGLCVACWQRRTTRRAPNRSEDKRL